MNKSTFVSGLLLPGALMAAMALSAPAHSAELVLVSGDTGTGLGLDDPTPKAPVGLNPGKTLGDQRTKVYQFAMSLWGAVLKSDVPIYIGASFQPLACTPTSAVLGSAGTTSVFSDFAPGIEAGTWYASALADAIAGTDLDPGFIDINSRFNGDIGVNPDCLTGRTWYYGLDGNAPADAIDFLDVVMHEIGHGLGVQGFTNSAGGFLAGVQDIYSIHAYDNTLGKSFAQMTNAERAASLLDTGKLVWTGQQVNQEAALILDNRTVLKVSSPAAAAGSYEFGTATFGPAASASNLNGTIAAALDGGAVSTDACEAITNGAELAGRIALVDRGTCAFVLKAANVQAAGATGMIVVNTANSTQGMSGDDPAVTIPSVLVAQSVGNLIRANLPAQAAIQVDPNLLQGADDNGRVRLYAPNPYESGSSFSHFDTALSPNALMEPAATPTLQAQINVDLTPALYHDIGWTLNDGDARIGWCNTGVDVHEEGGLIVGANVLAWSDMCESTSKNRGKYVSCMADYTKRSLRSRVLTPRDAVGVLVCSALKR
ncbi:PA domain-containing protein [Pseudoxanthomonas dokdonensis]|uniref:PA domain-containing protein n=1 Tax=Pseudoxanthomonas dokdonensis TaxID=344882 RepID=A0A0R0CG35_9GAMM|nr:PA domain-containing protein [Pseudoxanthomonas dokdonensis]KRG68336.1 hypothetical protein ABB29_13535 [Pseudoxanthomonas dokdonensis]